MEGKDYNMERGRGESDASAYTDSHLCWDGLSEMHNVELLVKRKRQSYATKHLDLTMGTY